MSTEYAHIAELFKRAKVELRETDVFVDIGCGRGRLVNYLLEKGCRSKIVGIELDREIAEQTQKRLSRYSNVTIIAGDVRDSIPPSATVLFAYNPSGETIMREFKSRLIDSCCKTHDVTMIYHNCHQINVFREDSRFIVEDLGRVGPLPAALIRTRKTSFQN